MREFKAKGKNQAEYIRAIYDNDMVFCIGPAGSGKTACAIGTAINLFEQKICPKIILARPTVLADEGDSLGFLPGDVEHKMAPFLRPMYDELNTYYDKNTLKKMIENEDIEITPLQYLRGRTFHNTVVILDEAQNATYKQLKMITTRLGRSSKMIINGDVDQHDRRGVSDLNIWFDEIIVKVPGIGRCKLEREDIVRHKLVSAIVGVTDEYEGK